MHFRFLLFLSFFSVYIQAQVPAQGVVCDAIGNVYVALHAPTNLTYDGMGLPISKMRTNYLLKLDLNGDLIDITHVSGAADMAGPLWLMGDTLYFSQGHFYANDGGEEVNKGEIVLTKISTQFDRIFTVTIPLPVFGRPLAATYANNYWYVAYAYLGRNSTREDNKPNLAIAGIRHNYSDGWIKQVNAKSINRMWLEDEHLYCLGNFYYTLRWGDSKVNSEGVDYFLAEVNKTSGNPIEIKHGQTGQVLHAVTVDRQSGILGGSLLLEGQDQNLEQLFLGKEKNDQTLELLCRAENMNNSRIIDFLRLDDGGYIALANFSGTLDLDSKKAVSGGQQDICVFRISSKGKPVWIKNYGTTLNDEALALTPSTKGTFIIAYQRRDKDYADVLSSFFKAAPPIGEVSIMKLDENGEEIWQRTLSATRAE